MSAPDGGIGEAGGVLAGGAAAAPDLRAAEGALDAALAVWDASDRLRWANRKFRDLIPPLAPSIGPGLHFDAWLWSAVEADAVASARSDRKAWLARRAAGHRNPGAPFEVELAPGAWYRVREARLDEGGAVSCWTDIAAAVRERRAREASEQRFRDLIEFASDVVILFEDRRILFVNRSGAALLGADGPEALVGASVDSVLAPGWDTLLDNVSPATAAEIPFRALNGAALALEVRGMPLRDGPRTLTLLVARDVSAQRGAEAAARGAEHRLVAALESVTDVVALFDADDRLVLANRASRLLEAAVGERWRPGVAYRDYLEAALEAGLYPDAEGDRRAWFDERIARRAAPRGAVEIARQDGRWYRLSEHRLDDGGLLSIATDVTERRRDERRIEFLAHHDALTELPNRALFMDRLRQAVAQAARGSGKVAVLMLDLDNFKHVNDNLGHTAGDRLLVEVAGRLRRCVRASDTVARLGGDEFAVVQPLVSSPEQAAALAHRARAALSEPLEIDGRSVHAGASVGVTLFPDDADDLDALLRNADLALYRAKSNARRPVAFYAEDLGRRAEERLAAVDGLRRALAEDRFELHYQPKARLSDGRIVGGEALLRWRHPERGLLLPAAFIAHAEAAGLIVPIGEWALDRACAQLGEWVQGGAPAVQIWVNVSAAQFQDQGLIDKVRGSLRERRVEPRLLGLEITESALMPDAPAAGATLDRLVELGVDLAIDDFGTGYSSLNYLKRLPVGKLKIDGSFVRGVTRDPLDSAIVGAIVHLGHSLGMHVLAEGVETASQSAALRDLGCDQIQGRLIGPPLPAEDFAGLVAARAAPG